MNQNLVSFLFLLVLFLINLNNTGCSQSTSWSFGSYIFPINKSLEFEVTVISPIKPGISSLEILKKGSCLKC